MFNVVVFFFPSPPYLPRCLLICHIADCEIRGDTNAIHIGSKTCRWVRFAPRAVWYVKFRYIFMLSKRKFQGIQATREEKDAFLQSPCWAAWVGGGSRLTLWLWEVRRGPHPVTLLYRAGCEHGRQRYHPSATSPGPNGVPQTDMCDVHTPHTRPLFFFRVGISAGSTVSRLTNGFSNPLVCWKFFQPPRLKRRPKTYLNASAPSDSCLSRTPSRETETRAGEAKDIGKAQIMRCQAGQTVIVNYIYSGAFGEQPWCFQEYKVASSNTFQV